MPNKNGQNENKEIKKKRCMAEGRRERTHAWRFCGDSIRDERTSKAKEENNSRKSITERNGDLVLLTGREEASGPPFPASDHSAMNTN